MSALLPAACDFGGPLSITSRFCGGNIIHKKTTHLPPPPFASNAPSIRVELLIDQDPPTMLEKKTHSQWFYFKSTPTCDFDEKASESVASAPAAAPHIKVLYVIVNANGVAFPSAWPGSSVCVSTDGKKTWPRKCNTVYDKEAGTLSWTHTHARDEQGVYFAFFEPYTYDRHLDLVDRCAAIDRKTTRSGGVKVSSLGRSIEGRDIEMVTVGNGPLKCWIIHRQHPGETQAEFFAEGLLTRLCGLDDAGATDGNAHLARSSFTFYIVPNMNPDGSAHGYLRTNAGGQNLNREWCSTGDYAAPTKERSPEVLCVLAKMDEVGCDCFADIHGDEEMPFCFIAGAEGCANWGDRMRSLQGAFLAAYCRANSDMQKEVSYDPADPMGANLAVASQQIATRFDCLSITLEMPYKDCLSNPDPERGFTGGRCRKLGASIVDAFLYVKDFLRTKEPFWEKLGPEDAYVRPKEDWVGKPKHN